MIALQYSFRFGDEYDMQQIRQRVADRGHVFDTFPHLLQKAFLCNDHDGSNQTGERYNEYATFYLWPSAERAQQFVLGDAFKTVAGAFGRPQVRTWTVISFERNNIAETPVEFAVREFQALAPEADLADVVQAEETNHTKIMEQPGLHSHVVALDTERWELMRFSLWQTPQNAALLDHERVRNYEILHLSIPDEGTSRFSLKEVQ